MLGSGKHRDPAYLGSVAKVRDEKESVGKESSANSPSSTISDYFYNASDTPIPDESAPELEQGIVKTLQRGRLRRASLTLDEVIHELDEKVDGDGDGGSDDKISIPRSPAPEHASSLESISVSGCVDGMQSTGVFTLSKRGQPGSDIGSSPPGNAALRSSTPTQYPSFSDHDPSRSLRRGSHQAAASPFTLNHSQTLVPSPVANSSRSSLESAGSSYHTWEDEQDWTIPRITALELQPPAWHDLSDKAGELSSVADGNVEEIVQQYSGLNKGDFVAIQERLLFAAKLNAEVSEPRERRNSLRRRRPSASQSVSRIYISTVRDVLNNV
jgi:hypothetical protein